MLTVFDYIDRHHLPRKIILCAASGLKNAMGIPVVGPRSLIVLLTSKSAANDHHYRWGFRLVCKARVERFDELDKKRASKLMLNAATMWPCDYILADPTGETMAAAMGAAISERVYHTNDGFFEHPLRPDMKAYVLFSKTYARFVRTTEPKLHYNTAAHLSDLPEITGEEAMMMPHWLTVPQMAKKMRKQRKHIWYDLQKRRGKYVGVRFAGTALVMTVEDYTQLMTDITNR